MDINLIQKVIRVTAKHQFAWEGEIEDKMLTFYENANVFISFTQNRDEEGHRLLSMNFKNKSGDNKLQTHTVDLDDDKAMLQFSEQMHQVFSIFKKEEYSKIFARLISRFLDNLSDAQLVQAQVWYEQIINLGTNASKYRPRFVKYVLRVLKIITTFVKRDTQYMFLSKTLTDDECIETVQDFIDTHLSSEGREFLPSDCIWNRETEMFIIPRLSQLGPKTQDAMARDIMHYGIIRLK